MNLKKFQKEKENKNVGTQFNKNLFRYSNLIVMPQLIQTPIETINQYMETYRYSYMEQALAKVPESKKIRCLDDANLILRSQSIKDKDMYCVYNKKYEGRVFTLQGYLNRLNKVKRKKTNIPEGDLNKRTKISFSCTYLQKEDWLDEVAQSGCRDQVEYFKLIREFYLRNS